MQKIEEKQMSKAHDFAEDDELKMKIRGKVKMETKMGKNGPYTILTLFGGKIFVRNALNIQNGTYREMVVRSEVSGNSVIMGEVISAV